MENEENLANIIEENVINASLKSIDSLSTHGIPNMFRTKFKSIRFMWLALILISASFSTYFIIQSLSEYFHYNVTTQVRLINVNEMDYPTVTICNKNQISSTKSLNYLQDVFKRLNIDYELTKTNKTYKDSLSNIKLGLKYLHASRLFSGLSLDEKKMMTLNFSEMSLWTSLGQTILLESDFEWIFNEKYGNCYRFNSFKSRNHKILSAHQWSGLLIDFYMGKHEELDSIGPEKGLYMSIQDKNANPYNDLENIIDISSGVDTYVKIQKSVFYKTPKPYSDCDFNQDNLNNKFKNSNKYYDQIINANYSYSQALCLEFCRYDYMFSNQMCVHSSTTIRVPHKLICQINRYMSKSVYEHLQEIYDSLGDMNDHIHAKCLLKCPLECKTVKYDSFVSTSKYPSSVLEVYKDLLYKSNRTDQSKSLEIDNLVRLKIYFGKMNFMEYRESPSMSTFDLVSNLGGTLGLFLGMSILSFTEFIEIILQSIIILYQIKMNKLNNIANNSNKNNESISKETKSNSLTTQL